MDLIYIIRSIFALVLIIWLANVLLGKLNKYMQSQSKSIQIIERYSISKNSSLAIVKIVNRYYLMAFNEKNSDLLKEFTTDEVVDILEVMQHQQDSNTAQIFTQLDFSKLKDKYADFFGKDKR